MSCEHEFVGTGWSLYPKPGLHICRLCQKTPAEIALESQISALQQQLADEQGKREQYKARIRLLLKDLDDLQQQRCKGYDAMIARAEQAEAQAAVYSKNVESLIDCRNVQLNCVDGQYMCGMANGLELAVSIFTGDEPRFVEHRDNPSYAELLAAVMRQQFEQYVKENCKMIRHGIADGIGKPDDVDGKCGGYSQGCSDEPHDECKLCIAMANNEEYDEELGTAGAELLARGNAVDRGGNEIDVRAKGGKEID